MHLHGPRSMLRRLVGSVMTAAILVALTPIAVSGIVLPWPDDPDVPNDIPGLAVGTLPAELYGTVSEPADVTDIYSVSVEDTGAIIIAVAVPMGPATVVPTSLVGGNAVLSLFPPGQVSIQDTEAIVISDVGVDPAVEQIVWQAEEPGTYHVAVAQGFPGLTDYVLSLDVLDPVQVSFEPDLLDFQAEFGGLDPEPQELLVTVSGGSEATWTVTEDIPWLTIDPMEGHAPGTTTFTVSVDTSGLVPGDYADSIQIDVTPLVPPAPVGPVVLPAGVMPAADPQVPTPAVPVELSVVEPAYTQVAGETRFGTAVQASIEAYPEGLDPMGALTVVIATGRNWPDALGGTALAGALDGPILLVEPDVVPASVTTEIGRLGADKAIILGGAAAVNDDVEDALTTLLGEGDVDRIAGASRYETASMVASRTIDELGPAFDGNAFVATGQNFPDALAAAPLAAHFGWPLFLSASGGGGTITDAEMDEMEALGVTGVLILGGSGVVSDSSETALVDRFAGVDRLAGADRYATAVTIAEFGVASGMQWDGVAIATGTNFPDALAGGVLQGLKGSPMLLTKTTELVTATATALEAYAAEIASVTYFGGTGAVSQDVRDAVEEILDLIP